MKIDKIEIKADDPVEQKYEILGKLLQKNKEGLAKLQKEKLAKKCREEKD